MMNISTKLTLFATLAATTFAVAAAQGPDVYKSKCQMCHAADGSGNTPAGKAMKVPAVATFIKTSETDLIASTKKGKGKMPAFAGKLTDAQIKDAVTYLKSL
jgi:mono/diheme cytochrome c family protein